jgi:hypothetical protein
MEDNLNIWQMEDDLNIFAIGRRHQDVGKLKTARNIWANKRQPQYFVKWKTTPIFCQIPKSKESSAPACFSINVIILNPFNSFIL